jgi:hypothetical protein
MRLPCACIFRHSKTLFHHFFGGFASLHKRQRILIMWQKAIAKKFSKEKSIKQLFTICHPSIKQTFFLFDCIYW